METKKIIKKVSEEDIQGNYIYITKKYNEALIIIENDKIVYHNTAKRENYETTGILELNKIYFMIIDNVIIQVEAIEKDNKTYLIETSYFKGLYYKPKDQYLVEPDEEYKYLNLHLNYNKPNVNHIITPSSKIINDDKLDEKDCMTRNYYYIIKKDNKDIEMISFDYVKNGHYFMQVDDIKKKKTTEQEINELTQTKLDKIKNRIRKR